MSKTVKALVEIRGTRPLLWHAFNPEALSGSRKERAGTKGNDPMEWKSTVLAAPGGQLYLLPDQVFACMREGAKYTKRGRGSVQGALSATLQILGDRVLTDRKLPKGDDVPTDHAAPVYLDVRSVNNPNTRGRNMRYRVAASPAWTASFELTWDPTIVSREDMNKIIEDAGQLAGIGSGRSIGFGRFDVVKFKVLKS
jgi:hypothetical protein